MYKAIGSALILLLISSIAQANLLLNPSFEDGSASWNLSGNLAVEPWADCDPPNLADNNPDGDSGIALYGWINGGSGVFSQVVSGPSVHAGTVYVLSGSFHREPGFDPTFYELSVEWLDSGSNVIGSASNNLIGKGTAGVTPTSPLEWSVFNVTGTAPEGTTSIRAMVAFSGTSDLGGLQAARIDNCSLRFLTDDFEYSTNSGSTLTITRYTGPGGSVPIPEAINGTPVTQIGNQAFFDTAPASVAIPVGVTNIGWGAFRDCMQLTSVEIPNNVVRIQTQAFLNCINLQGVTLPDGITQIEMNVFKGCSHLSSISIPGSVTHIGLQAFYGCSRLTNVAITTGVQFIGQAAFSGGGVKNIMFPDSVTQIDNSAFSNCSGLTNVAVGVGITNIGDAAFGFCTNLMAIQVETNNLYYASSNGVMFDKIMETLIQYPAGKAGNYLIPDSVLRIAGGAFGSCSQMTGISIPNSVTNIGRQAFHYCTGLTNASISDNVISIGWEAFYGCSRLTNVVIPRGLTEYGNDAFGYCTNLTAISVAALNTAYVSLDGVLFNANQTRLIQYPGGLTGDYSIPDGVTNIYGSAFHSCSRLTGIAIPGSVTCIEGWAFENCDGLANIQIPNNVAYIGLGAFSGCDALQEITIPNSVTNIGNDAFANCGNLANITFSDSITLIDINMLGNCTNLTRVTLGHSITNIGASVFQGCSSLNSITIPASVTSLGNNAFYDCDQLVAVYFLGNAPEPGINLFNQGSAIIYYQPETTGWEPTWGGCETRLWNPTVQNDSSFGVQTNRFGFTIAGTSNLAVVVSACTNLSNPVWIPIETNTLIGGAAYFSDPGSTNRIQRFYRLSP